MYILFLDRQLLMSKVDDLQGNICLGKLIAPNGSRGGYTDRASGIPATGIPQQFSGIIPSLEVSQGFKLS